MARRNNSQLPFDLWDGIDRRGQERRQYQIPPYYTYQQQYQPPYPSEPKKSTDIADTTLTLQQIAGIIVVLGSLVISGFSAWSNLNKELDIQKNNFDQFKTQISKDVDDVQANVKELKHINEDMKLQNQKSYEALDRRLQDLDTSVTQMYNKVTTNK